MNSVAQTSVITDTSQNNKTSTNIKTAGVAGVAIERGTDGAVLDLPACGIGGDHIDCPTTHKKTVKHLVHPRESVDVDGASAHVDDLRPVEIAGEKRVDRLCGAIEIHHHVSIRSVIGESNKAKRGIGRKLTKTADTWCAQSSTAAVNADSQRAICVCSRALHLSVSQIRVHPQQLQGAVSRLDQSSGAGDVATK